MERKREKLGVGQLWGLQRALRGIGWVSHCPGVPLPEAIISGHHPNRVGPGPVSGSQQTVSFPCCPQERTLDFWQRGFSFLKGSFCLRLAPASIFWGKRRGSPWSLALPPPLFSAGSLPGCSITTRRPCGQPPRLARRLPSSLQGSGHVLPLQQ